MCSGQIVELEARSFHDVDALAVVSCTDQGSPPINVASGIYSGGGCEAGGKPWSPGGPAHYAPYGDPAGAAAAIFYRADPQGVADVIPKLTLNPCSDMTLFQQAAAANLQGISGIDVPVPVVGGGKDALFPPAPQATQATLFSGSPAVTRLSVPGAGHAITLEPTSGVLVDGMASWMSSTVGSPTGGVSTGVGDDGTDPP